MFGIFYLNIIKVVDILLQMTIAAAGLLTGYDGDFAFDKPGDQYGDHNYIGMRVVLYIYCAVHIEVSAS